MINMKDDKIKYDKTFKIKYRKTKNVLIFEDESGGKIMFSKGENKNAAIYINGFYKDCLKKYGKTLEGFYPYEMTAEQMSIFMNWYYENK